MVVEGQMVDAGMKLYRLADHVLDMQCVSHDYVVMGIDLVTDEEYTAAQ